MYLVYVPEENLQVNRRRTFGPLQTKSMTKRGSELCTTAFRWRREGLSGYEEIAAWTHVAPNPLVVGKCPHKGPESPGSSRSTEDTFQQRLNPEA